MPGRSTPVRCAAVVAAIGAVTVLSALLVLPAPSYDPWAWLLWGREIAAGELHTLEGPAFKPLPVAVTAVLSVLGPAAPVAWVLLARAAAAVAVWLAFRLGRRLGGGSVVAGVFAGLAVALCGRLLPLSASGVSEAMVLALALAAAEAWAAGRPRWSVGCAVGCGLLRVEAWPFLLLAGARLWRRRPQDRSLLAGAAAAVPLAWLVPELIGSGDLLRSAARAQVAEAGHPALASVPALASLGEAAAQVLWPLWVGVAFLCWRRYRRRDTAAGAALVPAAAGAAWIAVVAAMAQAGFSGEARYSLFGAALVSVTGAVGLAGAAHRLVLGATSRAPARDFAPRSLRWAVAGAVVVAVGVAVVTRAAALGGMRAEQAHQWRLQADLLHAVEAAGGRGAVLACGAPYVGRLRGPLAAYRLGVAKHEVEPDDPPAAPGVVFRSALAAGATPAPVVPPGFTRIGGRGLWQVYASC
ncbi:MAG TPA: hypothetical protein VM264_01385 [Acidimicrobiales bacterium]|nr:hypothetical protein [Acidimicrobiales bacterium]